MSMLLVLKCGGLRRVDYLLGVGDPAPNDAVGVPKPLVYTFVILIVILSIAPSIKNLESLAIVFHSFFTSVDAPSESLWLF